ncbi:hypothetical protein M9H77_07620 [Catharanthus roseus]|uniref:Uncharacterized protein n=1 Tax=Catharanthus roseus TaxID=4058 RepID=A0ACC0BVF6_CATRO|nr:hypothetical protein M9H77_07620 [Catharanthus roseus]
MSKLRYIDRESSLMPVIEELFSTAYHMLCRRHIDQNVLAKLTEMIKDEEVAPQFVNGSWHKLRNKIDEQENLRKLDVLKTKLHNRPDLLHYLLNTWLNLLAHKFVRVWTGQVLQFGVETTKRVASEHSDQIGTQGRVISVFTVHFTSNHVQENSVGYGNCSQKLCAIWKSFRIL